MAINPSTVSFTHKKYTTLPLSATISYTEPSTSISEVSRRLIVENAPNWATVIGKKVSILNGANNLNIGVHSQLVRLKISRWLSHPDPDRADKEIISDLGTFTIKLTVQATVLLSLTPNSINFIYKLGTTNPPLQRINVTSESSWTISKTKNWVNLSSISGNNNGSFQIGVTPQGLAIGTHSDTITVVDTLSTKTISLTLVISEADTSNSFLYVQPSSVNLEYTLGGYFPIKTIEYNASGNWTASSNKNWVNLSAISGGKGVGTLQLSLQNTSNLSQGIHNAEITFRLQGLVKTVFVTLNAYRFIEKLLNPDTLYFTDDENYIEISSKRANTHLSLVMNSNFESNIFTGEFVIPFYKGKGKRRIGTFPKKIISNRDLPEFNDISIFPPYSAALIDMTINEEDILSDTVHQVVPANNIKFIKGKKPISTWLSDMPNHRCLTKKGILLFSFLSDGSVANNLTITGSVSMDLQFSNVPNDFYTCTLPIEKLGDLEIGDVLNISSLNQNVTIEIVPDQIDSSIVLWENQWGMWDAFECSGEFITNSKHTSTSSEFVKNHLEKETKVIKSETKFDYKINTGWVYCDAEIEGLYKMIGATNIYIFRNGKSIKVKSTTKKLEIDRTNKKYSSFKLTFENVIR